MDEEKIKKEILEDEIQNEILVTEGVEPAKVELVGEQKKKQWEKCVEGLARHRAIKKQQMEEEKKRKAEEKILLKKKIREELERQKLLEETKKEMEQEKQAIPKEETSSSSFSVADYEEFMKWKKFQELHQKQKSIEEVSETKKPKKKKAKRVREESSSSESDSEEDETDFVPNPLLKKYRVEEEEEEERIAKERYKMSKKLPPKADLRREEVLLAKQRESDSQLLYNKMAPGKYFYI